MIRLSTDALIINIIVLMVVLPAATLLGDGGGLSLRNVYGCVCVKKQIGMI